MALTEMDIVSGISSLISIIIFTILGLIIISKYFKYRRTELLLFGITVIGLAEPFYGPSFSFLNALITGQGLPVEIYMSLSLIGHPFILLCFVAVITDLLYKEKRKIILLIFFIYAIIVEILMIYFLINDPSMVGVIIGITDAEYGIISRLYIISAGLVFVIGGTLFSLESIKSKKPELVLKGKILLPTFYLYAICGILDSALPLNAITISLIRIFLIISGVLFYIGFVLPESVKKFFLKEK
ncbi:MAG: hypothetical protein ACFFAO_11560 [Candidatus Hermodarchaeota archaeon]